LSHFYSATTGHLPLPRRCTCVAFGRAGARPSSDLPALIGERRIGLDVDFLARLAVGATLGRGTTTRS